MVQKQIAGFIITPINTKNVAFRLFPEPYYPEMFKGPAIEFGIFLKPGGRQGVDSLGAIGHGRGKREPWQTWIFPIHSP